MPQRAIVNAPTTGIAQSGQEVQLPAGSYAVADLDGAPGVTYVIGPAGPEGGLLIVKPDDPAITVVTPGEPFQHPDLPPELLEGFVGGECGHRVASSEWRAGYRLCERCPS